MSDTASLVKEKIDIVDFLGQYIKLFPAGRNFRAVCPFHKEKTPSFMVSPDKQIWHCFGCGDGGDVIKFLMLYENLEFYDALKILAEKAGVNLNISGDRDFKSYNLFYTIMEEAKEFFKSNLYESDEVKQYLKDRGLKGETVKEFELGVAPKDFDVLSRHLLKKGFSVLDIEKSGLIFKTQRGTYWDRFRNRLMFPLYNHVGKVVGFTGRVLSETKADTNQSSFVEAKYINSPESPIFQKSRILYGFHKTKVAIREQKTAVLVEGQMDFLMMWQDGVKNVVATSGTALTKDHLSALKKIADELILSFDADEAGQAATERSIDLASELDFSTKVLILDNSKFKDPADIVKEMPGTISNLLDNAILSMEYYFHKYLLKKNDGKLEFKNIKQNLRIVLSKIKKITSSIERSYWIKKLSDISDLGEGVLLEEMENLKNFTNQNSLETLVETEISKNDLTRRDLICQRLLGLAMDDKELYKKLKDYLKYFKDSYKKIYNNEAIEGVSDLISLKFSSENADLLEQKTQEEFDRLIYELKLDYLKEKQRILKVEMDELEKAEKESDLVNKVKEFDIVSKEIHNMKIEAR
ncbi:DNA primase [Patescibacteria group bacterium]|nr:DNA primase [Patescibacteria group bacterium]